MTKRLLPLLLCLMMVGGWSAARATNYPIAAGASTSTVQSAINAAAAASGGNTVTFAAGTYSLTQISVPCPASPLVITGPATTYPTNWNARPTAVITSAYTGEGPPIFNLATPCNSPGTTIEYLEVNGNRPTSGGGAIYVGTGGYSNLNILYNYFHGNQEIMPTVQGTGPYQYWAYDDTNANLIRLDGTQGGNTDSNITIEYNILGNPVAGDCSNVMSFIGGLIEASGNPSTPTAQVFKGYDSTGSNCSGLTMVGNFTDLFFEYNIIQQQEQGIKGVEGGQTQATLFIIQNTLFEYNDISFIHRAFHETQMSPTSQSLPFVSQYNDMHDPVAPAFTNWILSSPQLTYTVASDNLMITNTSGGANMPPGYEWWGNASNTHLLAQGYNACAIEFGFGVTPSAIIQDNIIQSPSTPCSVTLGNGTTVYGIQNEEPGSVPVANYPTISGNTFSSTVSAVTSVAPSISPASGSFTGSRAVTITDNGNVSGAGPRGNTGIWYTTDGTTPVPRAGTSKYCSSPCNFSVTSTTTVNAVGMWGAITQPASYPTGYGFVPSAVVSATYTVSGGTPTAATPVFSPTSENFSGTVSVSVSDTTTGATIHCTTNGTIPTTSSPVYSSAFSVTATTTIQCIAAATGYNNSAVGSGTYTLSAPTPTVLGSSLANAAGSTYTNALNGVYAVAPSGTWTTTQATLCFGYGTVTSGKSTDILLVQATSSTTEASTPVCHATYTQTSNTGPGCVNVPVSGCGNLSGAYWVDTVTNDPLGPSSLEFGNCGGSCNATVPTLGNGTLWGYFASQTYGSYSSIATTLMQGVNQPSQYFTLAPALLSGQLGNTGSINTLVVGAAAIQFTAYGNYGDGSVHALPDAYGNTATWSSSNASILTVGSTGLVACAAPGTANVKVISTPGGINFTQWGMTCTSTPTPTLTSVSLATTGGATSVTVGTTNQILATCHYSDGSTTACNTSDTHGNAVSMWTTSGASIVSLSSSGLATGVAAGSANLSATVAGLTSPSLALTVTSTHTLTGAYLSTPGSANTMVVGGTLQFSARCTYSDGTTQDCTVTDLYGDAVSSWSSSNTPVMTIENAGAATPGLASALTTGTAQAQATIDGSTVSSPWTVTISPVPVTLTGITLATTGGVTGIFQGQTNQLIATCLYSDGSTTTCNTTDSHGNVAGSYASSATGHATVNAITGLVTGVGAGTTNLTAQAGTFTSPNLPLMVALVPSGTYTITISGGVRFTGKVSF